MAAMNRGGTICLLLCHCLHYFSAYQSCCHCSQCHQCPAALGGWLGQNILLLACPLCRCQVSLAVCSQGQKEAQNGKSWLPKHHPTSALSNKPSPFSRLSSFMGMRQKLPPCHNPLREWGGTLLIFSAQHFFYLKWDHFCFLFPVQPFNHMLSAVITVQSLQLKQITPPC